MVSHINTTYKINKKNLILAYKLIIIILIKQISKLHLKILTVSVL